MRVHLDIGSGWNLILTNGTERRRYVENNPFGFAPAFGFNDPAARAYVLRYQTVSGDERRTDDCVAKLKTFDAKLELCSSFGSATSFFATSAARGRTHLGHYVIQEASVHEDFPVADIAGEVENIFFLPPPDAPGGTITLLLREGKATYRAFLDTPRG